MEHDKIKEEGMTLIALIVTIIILLILAFTVMTMVIGDNGLFARAANSKKMQEIAEWSEKLELQKGPVELDNIGVVTLDKFMEQLKKDGIITDEDIIEDGDDQYKKIVVDDKYVFLIEQEVEDDVKITYNGDTKRLRISFDSNGGESFNKKQVLKGAKYGDLPTPTREGHTFVGWYTEEIDNNGTGIEINKDSIVEKDKSHTLYAKWNVNNYTITYNLNGGTNNEQNMANIEYGTKVKLYDPTREGYTFDGWYTDEHFANKITEFKMTQNLQVYAKWNINNYTITYNLNGGTNNSQNISVAQYGTKVNLYNPSKAGHAFGGWYTESNFANQITEVTITRDITIYAKWTVNSYAITYNMNGGTNNSQNPARANYGTNVNLANPTRSTCSFGGWYTDSALTKKVTSVNIQGNVTVYAKWTHSNSCYRTVTQYHDIRGRSWK